MTARTFARGAIWVLVGLLLLIHAVFGWFFSGVLIEDGFEPDPTPIVIPAGEFELLEVTYDTPLGPMDALHLPASGETWVIHVHGKGATPAEADHLFAPLQAAGYPQLAITYRNDEGQPLDPSGYYQYGATEWADIEAAVEFAEANGARKIVFSGFSTGGSHVLSFMYRFNLDEVRGVILDSPNIDFGDTVDYRAGLREMPVIQTSVWPTITSIAKFLTSLRIGVNWRSLDYVDKATASLRTPTLVHHGTEDMSVPLSQSLDFAEAAPDLVRVVQVPGAGHVESFETQPEAYVDVVLRFLDELS